MTFCGTASASAEGGIASDGASIGGVCKGAGSTGAAGFGGAAVASSEARMREIGGKTARLVFGSPASVFLRGFFLSMRETLSTSWSGAGEDRASDSFGEITRDLSVAVAAALAGAASLFNSCFGAFGFAEPTGL